MKFLSSNICDVLRHRSVVFMRGIYQSMRPIIISYHQAIVDQEDDIQLILTVASYRPTTVVFLFAASARIRWERIWHVSIVVVRRLRWFTLILAEFTRNVFWVETFATPASLAFLCFALSVGASDSTFLIRWVALRVRGCPLGWWHRHAAVVRTRLFITSNYFGCAIQFYYHVRFQELQNTSYTVSNWNYKRVRPRPLVDV